MKSITELIKIKKACENKRKKYPPEDKEYVRLSSAIVSLNSQISEQWDDQYGEAVSGEDGYLGDGVYVN